MPREEVIDGYRVIKVGERYAVYLRARGIYRELGRRGWRPDASPYAVASQLLALLR